MKMDAKIEAQTLIEKYAIKVDIFTTIDGEAYIPNGVLTTQSGIRIAMMEVDAILKVLLSVKGSEAALEYTLWSEVRAELEAHLKAYE